MPESLEAAAVALANSMEVKTMNARGLNSPILAGVMPVASTAFAVTGAQHQACCKGLSQLMETPALLDLYTCWRVHGSLLKQ